MLCLGVNKTISYMYGVEASSWRKGVRNAQREAETAQENMDRNCDPLRGYYHMLGDAQHNVKRFEIECNSTQLSLAREDVKKYKKMIKDHKEREQKNVEAAKVKQKEYEKNAVDADKLKAGSLRRKTEPVRREKKITTKSSKQVSFAPSDSLEHPMSTTSSRALCSTVKVEAEAERARGGSIDSSRSHTGIIKISPH